MQLNVDSVVCYDFGNDFSIEPKFGEESDYNSIIEKNGSLSSSVRKFVTLDKKTAIRFSKSLYDKKSYGGSIALCFEPHLGVVYYSKGKVIANINICISCNRIFSSYPLNSLLQGKNSDYFTIDGMSDLLKKQINELLISLKFSHQLKIITKPTN